VHFDGVQMPSPSVLSRNSHALPALEDSQGTASGGIASARAIAVAKTSEEANEAVRTKGPRGRFMRRAQAAGMPLWRVRIVATAHMKCRHFGHVVADVAMSQVVPSGCEDPVSPGRPALQRSTLERLVRISPP
jgi:hypothetical protein